MIFTPRKQLSLISFLFLVHAGLAHKATNPQANPISFIENKGQWPEQIRFMTPIPGGYMYFGPNAFRAKILNPHLAHAEHNQSGKKEERIFSHAYEIEFEGGHAKEIRPVGSTSPTLYNFYLSQNPKEWATGARASEEVHYREMYPGVDLKLYHQAGFLKYDLVLKNASDIRQVKMRYNGLDGIRVKNGNLLLKTTVGDVEERIPLAYQTIHGKRKRIECHYRLTGNLVQFAFPNGYQAGFPMVIDPQVVFYTYSGGTSDNWGNTAVGDRFGQSYMAGTVYGPGFPKTLGAYDISFNGQSPYTESYDIGIQKFSPNGSQLLASTFLGGGQADSPHSINLDNDDNLLILGSTSSLNFPVSTQAFQKTFGGGSYFAPLSSSGATYRYNNGSDLFISRLKADGNELLASTYLGGTNNDGVLHWSDALTMNYGDAFRGDITTAPDGSVLIGSHTNSNDFPMAQAFQNNSGGSIDGVVVRMRPGLDGLIWSTYLGGTEMDAFYSIQMQGTNKVVVCGGSKSDNFPLTANPYQSLITGPTNPGRNSFCDAVLASFSLSSGSLLHSTYSGTNRYDQAYLVQSDPAGNVYIFGQTQGTMPKSSGTYGSAGGSIFLQKFNPDLTALGWGTTIGSGGVLVPSAFLVDTCGRLYFSGWGGDSNFHNSGYAGGYTSNLPTTQDALKPTSDGSDFYFCVLGSDAQSFEYASFFGGSVRGEHVDGGMSRFDKSGTITQATCGCKSGSDYFAGTTGSYSPAIKSTNCNQGVVKINLGILKAKFDITSQQNCGQTITFRNNSSNGRQYTWFWGDVDSLVSNLTTVTHNYPGPGTYIVLLKATNSTTCHKLDFFADTITLPNPFSFSPDTTFRPYCKGDQFNPVLPAVPEVTRKWITQKDIINNNYTAPLIKPSSPTLYTIENKNTDGCILYTYYRTTLKSDLVLAIKDSLVVLPCESKASVYWKATGNDSDFFRWTFGYQKQDGPSYNTAILQPGKVTIKLNGRKNTCPDSVSKSLTIPPFDFKIQAGFSFETVTESCSEKYVQFSNLSTHADRSDWNFGDGTVSKEKSPVHTFSTEGTFDVSLKVNNANCESKTSIPVEFAPVFIPNLLTVNQDGLNELFIIKGLGTGVGFDVFDRWGKRVYSSGSYQNDWDPSGLVPGTYFFHLRFPSGKGCNSWVEVVR